MENTTQEKKEVVTKVPEKVVQPTETLTMTRAQLEAIIDDKIKNRGVPQKPKRVTDRVARMRVHNGKVVIGYGNVKERMDMNVGKPVAWMDITLEDNSVVTVPYLDFLNSPNSVQVQIKLMSVEEVVTSEGYLKTQNPNPKDIKNWSSAEIEAAVTSEKRTVTVIILDGDLKGKELVVDSNALNA